MPHTTDYLIRFLAYDSRMLRINATAIFVSRSMLNSRQFGFVLATTLQEMDKLYVPDARRLTPTLKLLLSNKGQTALPLAIEPGWERELGDYCYDIIDNFSHSGDAPRDILMRSSWDCGRIIWSGHTPAELARACN